MTAESNTSTVTIHVEATEAIAQCHEVAEAATEAREALEALDAVLTRLRRPQIDRVGIAIHTEQSPAAIAQTVARTIRDLPNHSAVTQAVGAGVDVQKIEIVVGGETGDPVRSVVLDPGTKIKVSPDDAQKTSTPDGEP